MSNEKSVYPCPLCTDYDNNPVYKTTSSLYRHLKLKHDIKKASMAYSFDVHNHKCLDCKLSFKYIAHLRDHLETEHEIQQAKDELMFLTEEELMSWLSSLVDKEYCQYFLARGIKKKEEDGNETQVTYYNCNRSIRPGSKNELTTRKRALKRQGSCKLEHSCTSQIKVEKINNEGPYKVTFFKTHYKHELEIQHLKIPKNTRANIAEKLACGVPATSILESCKTSATETLKRSALITRKDIHNITKYSRQISFNSDFSPGTASPSPIEDSPQKTASSPLFEPSDSVPTYGFTNAGYKSASPSSKSSSLSPQLLNDLKKPSSKSKSLGPPIHDDIIIRWDDIAKHGLPEEERSTLVSKYPVPENCGYCVPPHLNDEIRTSLTKDEITKDERIVTRQEKLGACLAANEKILSSLMTIPDPSDHEKALVATLSDQSLLLSDLFHDVSNDRRSLIMANINPEMHESLESTSIGDTLFDFNLEDINSAKALQTSSEVLQKTSTSPKASKNSKNSNTPAA